MHSILFEERRTCCSLLEESKVLCNSPVLWKEQGQPVR
ncbi:defensin beta 34 [Mus musculus]|nr:defensin beta 34 [Mus musculus]